MWGILMLLWILLGCYLFTAAYAETIYRMEYAIGYLQRAQASAYAEDMLRYIQLAEQLLPKLGNPVWIFPTPRTDFSIINDNIRGIESRLQILSSIRRDSSAYQQGMSDIRGKLSVIIGNVGEAAPYMLFTPLNISLAIAWLLFPPLTYRAWNHRRRASTLVR